MAKDTAFTATGLILAAATTGTGWGLEVCDIVAPAWGYGLIGASVPLYALAAYFLWRGLRRRSESIRDDARGIRVPYPKWWKGSKRDWARELRILSMEHAVRGHRPNMLDLQQELAERWRRLGKLPPIEAPRKEDNDIRDDAP